MLGGFITYVNAAPITAGLFLLAYTLVDGIDGALARYQKKTSNAGALLDMILDHSGMVLVIVVLAAANLINAIGAIIYVYLYTLLVIFIIIRNSINKPIKKAVRSKYIVYGAYGLWALFQINIITPVIILFSALMIPPIITSFTTIYNHLGEK